MNFHQERTATRMPVALMRNVAYHTPVRTTAVDCLVVTQVRELSEVHSLRPAPFLLRLLLVRGMVDVLFYGLHWARYVVFFLLL
jgi:hypothetical protein